MKRFAKTLVVIGTLEPDGIDSLVSKYRVTRKQAKKIFISAQFDLCHLVR
ncbi:hypothetical protein VPHK479_0075 [Vibrio phage K479]